MLAYAEYYPAIFQSVNRLANLADTVVVGNPEPRAPEGLLAAARSIPPSGTPVAAILRY